MVGAVLAFCSPLVSAAVYDVNADQGYLFDIPGDPNEPADLLLTPFLYKATATLVETGNTALFEPSFTQGGFRVTLQLEPGQAKPQLSYLTLKVAGWFGVWDISGWNAADFDSLTLYNDYTPELAGKVLPIVSINLYGTPNVPDAGVTLVLLGAGLLALGVFTHLQARNA